MGNSAYRLERTLFYSVIGLFAAYVMALALVLLNALPVESCERLIDAASLGGFAVSYAFVWSAGYLLRDTHSAAV